MVRFTVVLVGAVLGVTFRMVGRGVAVGTIGDGGIRVAVGRGTVGMGTVGEAGAGVRVGRGVAVTTITVGVIGVNVKVGEGVSVTVVGEGMGEAVGVITIGLPNSLQPRSGAAPINTVSGLDGIGSPLTSIYCATPRSMAGEFP